MAGQNRHILGASSGSLVNLSALYASEAKLPETAGPAARFGELGQRPVTRDASQILARRFKSPGATLS